MSVSSHEPRQISNSTCFCCQQFLHGLPMDVCGKNCYLKTHHCRMPCSIYNYWVSLKLFYIPVWQYRIILMTVMAVAECKKFWWQKRIEAQLLATKWVNIPIQQRVPTAGYCQLASLEKHPYTAKNLYLKTQQNFRIQFTSIKSIWS